MSKLEIPPELAGWREMSEEELHNVGCSTWGLYDWWVTTLPDKRGDDGLSRSPYARFEEATGLRALPAELRGWRGMSAQSLDNACGFQTGGPWAKHMCDHYTGAPFRQGLADEYGCSEPVAWPAFDPPTTDNPNGFLFVDPVAQKATLDNLPAPIDWADSSVRIDAADVKVGLSQPIAYIGFADPPQTLRSAEPATCTHPVDSRITCRGRIECMKCDAVIE